MRDLARCLGACVSEDPELQKDISPLLTERNQELTLVGMFDVRKQNRDRTVFSLCHRKRSTIFM